MAVKGLEKSVSTDAVFVGSIPRVLLFQMSKTVRKQSVWVKGIQIMDGNQRLYGVTVGIGQYQHLKPLDKPATDALDMRDALVQAGYAEAAIDLLIDQQATRLAVREALQRLAQRAGPHDTAIITVSGHGTRTTGPVSKEYLCPVDADMSRPDETCISGEELTEVLRAVRAGRLVVFLDVCHAGGLGEPRSALRAGFTSRLYSNLAGRGRAIIAACREDELSWEYGAMRNGLFTHYVLEGLRGKAARPDGRVWLSNLFGFVYEQVTSHGRQHPFQKAACEDFVVAVAAAAGSEPLPSAPLRQGGAPIQQPLSPLHGARLRQAMHAVYDRPSFELLLGELGLDYYDLRGDTLELKMMYLLDRYRRRRQEGLLINKLISDHPHLAQVLAEQQ